MADGMALRPTDALILVDIQNDFCPGGALAVPHGDEVVPVANRLARRFETTILTQDWHPAGHHSFATTHPGKAPYETTELSYGRQVLWPDHCVQGTPGADFHPGLQAAGAELIVRKGFHPEIDSYSAFYENDRKTPTGLGGYLRERGFRRLFFAGLALDFCVAFSAEDAVRCGFEAIVVEDGCRAIDLGGSLDGARARLSSLGVPLIASGHIV
jgi:nicotinamidase/pyrazinamidase